MTIAFGVVPVTVAPIKFIDDVSATVVIASETVKGPPEPPPVELNVEPACKTGIKLSFGPRPKADAGTST